MWRKTFLSWALAIVHPFLCRNLKLQINNIICIPLFGSFMIFKKELPPEAPRTVGLSFHLKHQKKWRKLFLSSGQSKHKGTSSMFVAEIHRNQSTDHSLPLLKSSEHSVVGGLTYDSSRYIINLLSMVDMLRIWIGSGTESSRREEKERERRERKKKRRMSHASRPQNRSKRCPCCSYIWRSMISSGRNSS